MIALNCCVYGSTVDKLNFVKSHGTEDLSKLVASKLLDHWRHDILNEKKSIYFWWHATHESVIKYPKTDSVTVNGGFKPEDQPDGPWAKVFSLERQRVRIDRVIADFTNAGFSPIDGSCSGTTPDQIDNPGNKSLGFEG